jgi:hypothetical protein
VEIISNLRTDHVASRSAPGKIDVTSIAWTFVYQAKSVLTAIGIISTHADISFVAHVGFLLGIPIRMLTGIGIVSTFNDISFVANFGFPLGTDTRLQCATCPFGEAFVRTSNRQEQK